MLAMTSPSLLWAQSRRGGSRRGAPCVSLCRRLSHSGTRGLCRGGHFWRVGVFAKQNVAVWLAKILLEPPWIFRRHRGGGGDARTYEAPEGSDQRTGVQAGGLPAAAGLGRCLGP